MQSCLRTRAYLIHLALFSLVSVSTLYGQRAPVLIELFTSEGCSSCPPADALVQQLDAKQPIPGVEIVVLSEHVDYWNHDGWKDQYSSAAWSERQSAYARVLGLGEVYTPQLLVNGSVELPRANQQQITQALEKAASAASVAVKLDALTVDGAVLSGHIQADGHALKHNADVYLALALSHADTQVAGGENRGRHLTHVAVLEQLKKLTTIHAGKSINQDFELKLTPGADPGNIRLVAFVQEPGLGKVFGTAMQQYP